MGQDHPIPCILSGLLGLRNFASWAVPKLTPAKVHSNGGDRGALAVRTRRLWEGLKIGAMLNQADLLSPNVKLSAPQHDAGGANHNAAIKPQCWGDGD
jgi:hypothetical protein